MVKRYNHKTLKGLITLFLLVLLISVGNAQNEVAIGSNTTKSNAILWLNGNGGQGLILPVVTNKTVVSGPDKGMIVYDNSDNKVWYRSDNAWVEVGGGTSAGDNGSLTLQVQGNQLQLHDGTTTLSSVNIAGGTPANGAFMVWNGTSWQSTTLNDVNGTNGQVTGIKGKTVPNLPTTTQALVYDGSAWTFQPLTGGTDSQTLTFTSPNLSISNGNSVNLSALDKDAQTLTLTGSNLSISGGNSVTLPSTGVTSVTAGTGLTGGTITTTGTINVDVGTTANKIIQLDATGKLPAVDGSQLTNLPSLVEIGDISAVTAGAGLTGGGTTGAVSLGLANSSVTPGIYGSATAIPQMTVDAFGRITAVTTFPPLVADGSITGGIAGSGVKIAANTITDANILSLNASKITAGTLPVAQVPNLDATKITTGTFGTAQIPNLDAAKITTGTFSTAQIPNLDASKITTGAFNPAQIPDLDASKITSGIIPTTQGGTGLSLTSGSIGNGQLLIGANPGFVKANLTAGSGISITNGAGSIIISSTALGSVTNVSGTAPITVVNGTTTPIIGLANTAVSPNTYGTTVTIPQITVDAQGRITGANNQTIPTANTTTTGLISNTDWNTFNSKGNGTVTNVTGTLPVTVTNGSSAPVISMSQATTTTSGYLSSADWNTFNSKGAGTVTSVTTGTGLTGGPITASGTISLANTAVSPATYGTTLTIPQIAVDQQGRITAASNQTIPTANTTTTGLLSNTDWNTFNTKGNGSVTSVALTLPNIFTVSGSPVTTTGTLSASLASQTAATVFAGPASGSAIPTFRALVSTDVPALDASKITTGTFATARIPSLDAAQITTGILPVANGGTGKNTWSGLVYGSGTTLGDISDGTAGQFLRIVGTTPSWQTFSIMDADVNTAAAIAGTKINPDFGTQNISGGGSTKFGAATITWPGANASGVLTNDGTGSLSWAASDAWTLTGNASTNPTNNFIGTTDAQDLVFRTNNTEYARLTSAGNLGVGTSTPTRKLEVFASGAGFRHTDGNVIVESQIAGSDAWFGTTSANHNFHILAGGFDAMIVRGDNNSVGIGRNPVVQKFEVEGGGYFNGDLEIANQIRISGGSPANGYVLTSDATGLASWQAASGLTNPMTTIGDIIYAGVGGTPTRLAAGTSGQVLTSNGAAAPSWTSVGSATGWSTAGNIAIATDYIGTNNNIALNIRVNNTESGIIDPTNLNTAFGQNSASSLIAGGLNNTAFGYRSLAANTTGDENTAIGYNALQANTTANYNTAVGKSALFTQGGTNVNGSNTAIGYHTLYENTTGYFNTSLGYLAGTGGGPVVGNTTGFNNTFIGANSGPTANNFSNATAIGAGTTVNASNKIRLGNAAVTVIEGQVSYSNSSDRRLKHNIKEIEYGLDFIKSLKPVSYKMKNLDDRQNWGFIAQDIEELVGTTNAVLTVGEDSLRTLSLRYTDFIAPMVKAMQEQQSEIEQLKAKLKEKNDEVSSLETSVNTMKGELEEIKRILGVEAKAKTADKKLK